MDELVATWAPRFEVAFDNYSKRWPDCGFHPSKVPYAYPEPDAISPEEYVRDIVKVCVWSNCDPVPVLQTWLHVLGSLCIGQAHVELVKAVLPKGVAFEFSVSQQVEPFYHGSPAAGGRILHYALEAWNQHLPRYATDKQIDAVYDSWSYGDTA